MSTSQAVILRDLIREYDLGRSGTATSASTTTLVDASNFGFGPGGQFPTDAPIRITSGAAIGLNGFKSKIDPSTGTITFQPAAAGNTGTPTFVISNVVDHIDRLIEAVNRSLQRRCSHQWKVWLTDIIDGDFLGALAGAAISDNWSQVNAAFVAGTGSRYVSLAFPDGFAMRGAAVVSTATNGYIQSASVPVHPLTTRYFFVPMRASGSGTTAELILRDITNTAVITPTFTIGSATTQSQGFVIAKGTYSVPAGCTQIAWRFNVQESGKTCIFGPIADVEQGQTVFPSPIHLNSEDDIMGYYAVGVREVGAIANPGPDTLSYLSWQPDGVKVGDFGWGFGLQFESAPPFPIAIDEYNFFPALTSDTDTTDAPEELVLCGAAMELYEMLGFGSTEIGGMSRGHLIPTLTMQRLQGAEKKWRSAYMQRLRATRKVRIKRDFSAGVYA